MKTPDMNDTQPLPIIAEDSGIRIVSAMTSMQDDRALMNAYDEDNPIGATLMARASNLGEVVELARQFDATVLILDHQMGRGLDSGELLVTTIQKLRHNPEHPIITIGVCYDPAWAKNFIEAGAFATINGPITTGEIARLNGLLPGLLQKAYRERQSPNYINHFTDSAVRALDSTDWQRLKINVWGPKGGTGVSFVARELAVGLGVLCDRNVLLIDTDMNGGAIASYLGLSCERGGLFKLANLFHANGHLTPLMLSQCITPYALGNRMTNLKVLTGNISMSTGGDPIFLGNRGIQFANALVDLLNTMNWDFVIWDLGKSFHVPMHLVPLKRNDLSLVLATSEKVCAIQVMYALQALSKHVAISPDRFRLIVNKWDDSVGLDLKELISTLKLPQFARIPMEEHQVLSSLNHGRPLVLEHPDGLSNAIINATTGIFPAIGQVWNSRGGKAPNQKRGLAGLKLTFGRR